MYEILNRWKRFFTMSLTQGIRHDNRSEASVPENTINANNDRVATDNESLSNEQDDSKKVIDKVKNIPIDKLREIVTNQIDLEIRLKHKELQLTEEEIGKCESQMITLRNYFKVPRDKSFESEPNEFTLKYYDLLNRSLSVTSDGTTSIGGSSVLDGRGSHDFEAINSTNETFIGSQAAPVTHTYRTRSTTSSLRPSPNSFLSRSGTVGCLYRRTDGVVVKLTCPDCKRTNFSSAQGFLNHSRIAHTQEYTSQDAAALICGKVLPDREQDEEGLSSINSLRDKNLDPSKNLNVNEIFFNGLSNSLNTVHRSSMDKSISPLEKDESFITGGIEESRKKPEPEKESELMKKLIKNGMANDRSSYRELIDKYKPSNFERNLFSDSSEEEGDGTKEKEKEQDHSHNTTTRSNDRKLKRRRSRANVGIPSSSHISEPDGNTSDNSGDNISKKNGNSDGDDELVTEGNNKKVYVPEIHKPQTRISTGSLKRGPPEETQPSLPKIRLKLKPETRNKKRKRV